MNDNKALSLDQLETVSGGETTNNGTDVLCPICGGVATPNDESCSSFTCTVCGITWTVKGRAY